MSALKNKIFIITGEQGEGKTSCLIEVVDFLKIRDVKMIGFVAKGYWKNGLRSGFDLVDVNTNNQFVLCKSNFEKNFQKIGRFYFKPETIAIGNDILCETNISNDTLIVIDEIGLFELKGQLWADSLKKLLQTTSNPILITVRKNFVEDVISHFKINNYKLFNQSEPAKEIAARIHNSMR